MTDWREVRVGSLVEAGILMIGDGHRMRNDELGSEGVPFVRGGDIGDGWVNTDVVDHIKSEFSSKLGGKLSKAGDSVFITKGTVGRAGFIRPEQPPVVFSPQVALWRVLDPTVLDSRFIFYLLRSPAFLNALDAVKSHGAMAADYVSISQQKDFSVQLPSVETQSAIGRLLGALDDRIELNRRICETLEAISQAIFRDWFVEFGPVRRKAAGIADPVEVIGGLTTDPLRAAELAVLFPTQLANDGAPEGWSDRLIGDLVEVAGGSTPSTTDERLWRPAEHRWATPKDLSTMSDLALFETGRRISAAGLASITSGLLPKGSVLLSSRAPIGYLAIAQAPVAINQGFIALKPTEDLGSAYLYLWCKANMEAILANANGSTFQEISKRNFRPITSALPDDLAVTRAFGQIAEPLIGRIICAAAESRALAEIRDYLLPRLMSGEVGVTEPPRAESA
jgi:type I restriction enzyme S subunit